jgi:hypothetical protein
MKKILVTFLSGLTATMFYWSLVQYTDTGTVDLVTLILTPEPWVIALIGTTGIFIWRKFSGKKEAV